MKTINLRGLAAATALLGLAARAHAGWAVSVNLGIPLPCPPPVVVAPPPMVIATVPLPCPPPVVYAPPVVCPAPYPVIRGYGMHGPPPPMVSPRHGYWHHGPAHPPRCR